MSAQWWESINLDDDDDDTPPPERRKPGPKPRHLGRRIDLHIYLSEPLVRAIDALALTGRSDYIEEMLRKLPPIKGKIAEQERKQQS